jgi:hypothetical protein
VNERGRGREEEEESNDEDRKLKEGRKKEDNRGGREEI